MPAAIAVAIAIAVADAVAIAFHYDKCARNQMRLNGLAWFAKGKWGRGTRPAKNDVSTASPKTV